MAQDSVTPSPIRLSIVIEWANTRLNGQWRAAALLDRLERQWQELLAGAYPETLPGEGREFLTGFDKRAELLIVSSEAMPVAAGKAIHEPLSATFALRLP